MFRIVDGTSDVFVLLSRRASYGQGMLDRLAMAQEFGITEEPLNLVSLQSLLLTYTYSKRYTTLFALKECMLTK